LTFAGTDASTLNIGTGGTLGSNAFTSTAYAPLASPTFTGTVTIPTPFTLGGVSVTSTGTRLNYLTAATGTTGNNTSSLVFSNTPTLTTPNIGAATGTSLSVTGALTAQATTNQLVLGTTNTTTISSAAPAASRIYTLPDFGANGVIPLGTAGNAISLSTTGATSLTLPTTGTLMANPNDDRGDLIYGGASGAPTRLGNGSSGQVLQSGGGTLAPTWATPSGGTVTSVSTAAANNGITATWSMASPTPALTIGLGQLRQLRSMV